MKLSPGLKRGGLTVLVLVVLFTVTGFFILPPILKTELERRAGEALGRTVTVGKVRVNPYAVSLTLENFDVRLKEGDGSFLGWSRLHVNFDPLASLFGAWTVGVFELDGFHVTAVLKKDGSFNFADILTRLETGAGKAPAKPVPAVRIGRLTVSGARLDFVDESRPQPFATTLGPVGFNLAGFHTTLAQGAPYHFEAVTETGERLVWTGTLSAAPLASAGELRLENIHLPKYAPYYADRVRGDLTAGSLSVSGRYEAIFAADRRVVKLADGALRLRGLALAGRDGQGTVVELPELDVTGITADVLAAQAEIASVVLQGGRLHVARDPDGSINLLNLVAPGGPAAAAPAPPAFMIRELAVRDFTVNVTDHATARPVRLGLTEVGLRLQNITLADGAEMPLQLTLGWAPVGKVKVVGTVAFKPELRAGLNAEVTGLALLPLSPYLEQFVNARITAGTLSTSGALQVAMTSGVPSGTFSGRVAVEQFSLVDGALNEELAGFATLALNGLQVSAEPGLIVTLAEATLASPYAHVRVYPDGTLNLASLARLSPGAGPPASPASPPKVAVERVVVTGGDFSLTDASLEPNVRMAVRGFGGTIAGLSSANLARADVELQALVDGVGPVAITGRLDPLGARKFVDLKMDLRNVDLLPLSPYSGKYAGYALARGQLNVAVQARLDDKQLDVANIITLNQFTFGAPATSADATKLPVRLGVALLKDMNGQIVIDVPVSGRIDDPSFRVGRVVLRVVVNLLTKAAVSPFALLGSMFGGGGEELAFQEFAPGASELQETERTKLTTMVKALTNRPGLGLGIEGGFDGPADTHALKRQKLAALVRGRIWEQRRVSDPNLPAPGQLVIEPAAEAAMLRSIFDEKFPPGTEFGAPLPPPPKVAAAPVPAKRSLLRRVVAALTRAEPVAEPAAPAAAPAETRPAGPSSEEMTGRLAEAMEVTDNDLRALAAARAQRVRDYFLNEGGIAAERIFLTSGATDENKGPRVRLTLQ